VKKLLLPLLLLLALPGFGQGRDTVFAVHKLFREKRASGDAKTAAGATVAAGTAVGSPLYTPPQPGGSETAAAVLMGGVPAAMGLLQMGRYSAQNEADVLKLYAEGWGLPPDIRRKLKRRHFKRTAKDVQAGL
jgi:hypothetical protein